MGYHKHIPSLSHFMYKKGMDKVAVSITLLCLFSNFYTKNTETILQCFKSQPVL